MSGGSFDYLYTAYDYEGINGLLHYRKQLVAMQKALQDYPHSELAVASTARLIKALDDVDQIVRSLLDDDGLANVFKAVEWHHSGDLGLEDVEHSLTAFNKRVLP